MMNDQILIHHGIKGQKWGIQNGPPYPLDASQKSSAEKRMDDGTKKEGKEKVQTSSTGKSEKSLRDKATSFYEDHEKELKIGAAVIGTSLAVYGGYCLYKNAPIPAYGALSYAKSDPLSSTINSYSDRIPHIPKNVTFHRISQEAIADYSDAGSAYVSYLTRDNMRYISASNNTLSFPGGVRNFVHTFSPTGEVRVPSSRQLAELFLSRYPNATDQQFRFVMTNGFVQWDNDYKTDPVMRRSIEMANNFKNVLLSEGYNAIVDVEDAGHSTALPLILLDPSSMDAHSRSITSAERVVATILR